MKRILFAAMFFLVGCSHHRARVIPAGGLTQLNDGAFGAVVRSAEEFQTILILNKCGLGMACVFDDLGLTTTMKIGEVNILVTQKNSRRNSAFMEFIGCRKIFICNTDGRSVVIESQIIP